MQRFLFIFLLSFLTFSLKGQIPKGTKFAFGKISLSQKTVSDVYEETGGDSEILKFKNKTFYFNPGIAYCFKENLFLGGSITESFQNYKQLEPKVSDGKSTFNGIGASVFIRYIISIPFQVKPFIQFATGKSWYNSKYYDSNNLVETNKYRLSSLILTPAISIFNKDNSRSFDVGLNVNYYNYSDEDFPSDKYKGSGWFLGYTVYFK